MPLPELPAGTAEGNRLYLTAAELNALSDYADVAEGNYEIAHELAGAVNELQASHNDLVRAGRGEHQLAEMRLQMLEEERRARAWDKISTWSILGLIGVASIVK